MSSLRSTATRGRTSKFVPRLEALESRQLLACAVFQTGTTLNIIGDGGNNLLQIAEDASAGTVDVTCDGQTQTFDGTTFDTVKILTGGGSDLVTYQLTGDIAANRLISADLGDGTDAFVLDSNANVLADAGLRVIVNGGNGNDAISVRDTGDVEAAGIFSTIVNGGKGNDSIQVVYNTGFLDGRLRTTIDGGAGSDTIAVNITPDTCSTGRVFAAVFGSGGNDTISVVINRRNSGVLANAAVDGGSGDDHAVVTTGVLAFNVEHLAVIPQLDRPTCD